MTSNVTGNVASNVTGNVAGNVTGNVAGNVTGNVKRLVLVIEDGTKTREEIMALLNLKGSGNFRANYLYPALNEGFIAKLYPDAESRTDQAYYLTEKGLRLYKELM